MSLESEDKTATVHWIDGMRFAGRSASGHSVVMDVAEEHGGTDSGPSPMEMILLGVGGCASIDVVSILKKARQNVINCESQLSVEKADSSPSVFTKIHLHFIVSGREVALSQVERAVALSAEKYCSAAIMIGRSGTEITVSSEVREI